MKTKVILRELFFVMLAAAIAYFFFNSGMRLSFREEVPESFLPSSSDVFTYQPKWLMFSFCFFPPLFFILATRSALTRFRNKGQTIYLIVITVVCLLLSFIVNHLLNELSLKFTLYPLMSVILLVEPEAQEKLQMVYRLLYIFMAVEVLVLLAAVFSLIWYRNKRKSEAL
jgi:4-amino-4-deoxy-L-arabinose transferase-like glycosyltransferase